MSRLLVLTRPSLVPGFQLAGIDAFGAEDIDSAEELIGVWLETQETGLLAIDEEILARLDSHLLRQLAEYEAMPHLAIPGFGGSGLETTRKHRIAERIRKAIGIHITFRGEDVENSR